MAAYVARRTLIAIPVLLIISIIIFLLAHAAPGGPLARYLLNPHLSRGAILQIEHNLGLDKPIWYQYLVWLKQIVTGQWGTSLLTGQPVIQMIGEALPNTLILMVTALVLTILIAIPLGILQALRQYSIFDYIFTGVAFFGFAMPTFFLAVVVLIVFAADLGWFPAGGMAQAGVPLTIGDLLHHLVLPACTLAFISIASYSRYLRSQMLEVLTLDYIRTARAKGLPPFRVTLKHAVRNALLPVITIFALDIAFIFQGAVLTEYVFAWPGMGRLLLSALEGGDYPLIMIGYMMAAALVVVFNLVADVVYAAVDPRISYA